MSFCAESDGASLALLFIVLQVNELYELVKKTETLSQILPQTLDRLLSLESLHIQGNVCPFL